MTTKQGTKSQTSQANHYHPCNCQEGTGSQCTARTRKSFAQGHDARMASRLATAVATGKMSQADAVGQIRKAGGSDLLVSKMVHSAELRKESADQPKKDRAPKAAKKSEDVPPTKPGPQVGKEVKVSHGQRDFKATIVRNANQVLVARHRLTGKDCDHPIS